MNGSTKRNCKPESNRIIGYDLARGLAILIMVVINFKVMLSVNDTFPGWLSSAVDFMDRRAAVMLVMIAGAGITLMTKENSMLRAISPAVCTTLLKRALFLFLTGYCLSAIWPADILHFYAVFIFLGIFLTEAGTRTLIYLVFFLWLISFVQFLDLFEVIQQISVDYILAGQILDILFTGYYPVFPWMTFYLTGMWLARKDISRTACKKKIFAFALLILLASESISRIPTTFAASIFFDPAVDLKAYLEVFYTINMLTLIDLKIPTPLSVISGVGSGLCLITLCLWMAEYLSEKQTAHLIIAGKTSLTIYIGHILVLHVVKLGFNLDDNQNILVVTTAALVFFFTGIKCLELWLVRHDNGPLETVMRKFPFTSSFFWAMRPSVGHK